MLLALEILAPLWALLLYAILTAPEGWEDADGFHYGREP